MFDLALLASWPIEFYGSFYSIFGRPWLRCLPLFVETFSLYVYISIYFHFCIYRFLFMGKFIHFLRCM